MLHGVTILRSIILKIALKTRNIRFVQNVAAKGTSGSSAKNRLKKCINCGENHSSLAMKCIKRKIILREKRKDEREKQASTYAGVTRAASNITPIPVQS